MTASLSLIVAAAAMIGCGVYLVLERSLTRVLIGFLLWFRRNSLRRWIRAFFT